MPNFSSNITINDREATPVAHVFKPLTNQGEQAVFAETADTLIGRNMLMVSAPSTNTSVKPRIVVKMPIVQSMNDNGITSNVVVRTLYGEVRLTLPLTSTLQERKNIVGLLANALLTSQAALTEVVVDGVPFA
jgi:hypothetical protein